MFGAKLPFPSPTEIPFEPTALIAFSAQCPFGTSLNPFVSFYF